MSPLKRFLFSLLGLQVQKRFCQNTHGLQHKSCNVIIVWKIELELVRPWLRRLDTDSYEQVVAALEILAEFGPSLGRPVVDTIHGSRHKNMKELRPGSKGRSELRVLFAFDPRRRAIMLVAGDKSGDWSKWYTRNIRIADDLFDEHLEGVRGGQ